ncbi:hypothetical protein LTR56_020685 [Elasticomyces elasticus]|nr:hypothetical protein LTR56_020685 [Elasticomyces elasticus]KAK3653098.1 hypothetical protein LTR22_011336 [Elasticomyces elasticus]KAK4919660.1 hypothetical protein LTR49_012724 [Elasticomyces elasticus]KAK5751247.1 hypothetical protein LTS12_018721 [Elasticomyces elasticus]
MNLLSLMAVLFLLFIGVIVLVLTQNLLLSILDGVTTFAERCLRAFDAWIGHDPTQPSKKEKMRMRANLAKRRAQRLPFFLAFATALSEIIAHIEALRDREDRQDRVLCASDFSGVAQATNRAITILYILRGLAPTSKFLEDWHARLDTAVIEFTPVACPADTTDDEYLLEQLYDRVKIMSSIVEEGVLGKHDNLWNPASHRE